MVQRMRRGVHTEAWQSTVLAIKAIGLNILIELSTALIIVALWIYAVAWWS